MVFQSPSISIVNCPFVSAFKSSLISLNNTFCPHLDTGIFGWYIPRTSEYLAGKPFSANSDAALDTRGSSSSFRSAMNSADSNFDNLPFCAYFIR
jgi:hypothetical protein